MGAVFSFSHLDESGERAIYSLGEAARRHWTGRGECVEDMRRIVCDGRLDAALKTPYVYFNPRHLVTFRKRDKDTELPNAAFDADRFEQSFEWKAMYDCFLGEEAEYRQLQHWVGETGVLLLKSGHSP